MYLGVDFLILQIESMEDWEMISIKFARSTLTMKSLGDQSLPNYSGGLAVDFSRYPEVDSKQETLYFKVIH